MKGIIKLVFVAALIGFSSIFYQLKKDQKSRNSEPWQIELKYDDSRTNASWYYEIYYQEKLLIRQTTIPGKTGNKGFNTKAEASKIAHLVVDRLRAGLSPIITAQDLVSNNIN